MAPPSYLSLFVIQKRPNLDSKWFDRLACLLEWDSDQFKYKSVQIQLIKNQDFTFAKGVSGN